MYKDLGGSYAVFASKGGAPTNPDWYHNILAHPAVEAEIGTEKVSLTARVAGPEEREKIWVPWKTANPGFAEYEAKTDPGDPGGHPGAGEVGSGAAGRRAPRPAVSSGRSRSRPPSRISNRVRAGDDMPASQRRVAALNTSATTGSTASCQGRAARRPRPRAG